MFDLLCIPVREPLARAETVLFQELSCGISPMDDIVRTVAEGGGKRIRPAVFLLAAALVGVPLEASPPVAAAVEMVHLASLLHDDVVDDAPLRRGAPSARMRWGNQVSVLVGDFIWSAASRIIAQQGNTRLVEEVAETVRAIALGELLEISHRNNVALSEEIYDRIIEGKTAALFALCGQAAAIMAGVGSELEAALVRYGLHLGRAFQLTDDALDYRCDEGTPGKRAGADLRAGYLTFPLIVARAQATPAEQDVIRDAVLARGTSPEQFREVCAIIERYGGIAQTLERARAASQRACDALARFRPSIERDALIGIAEGIVDRQA